MRVTLLTVTKGQFVFSFNAENVYFGNGAARAGAEGEQPT